MACQKQHGKACMNATKSCVLTKTTMCCWHEDKRETNDLNKIYMDDYGYIDVTYYGFTVPKDIYYCPSCKVTTVSADNIIEELKKVLEPPEAYKHRQTIETTQRMRDTRDKLREAARILEKKKVRELNKKRQHMSKH